MDLRNQNNNQIQIEENIKKDNMNILQTNIDQININIKEIESKRLQFYNKID